MIKIYQILAAIIIVLTLTTTAWSANEHHEKWYQEKWCTARGGNIEVLLPDKARVDCEMPDMAIEFDFAKKWAEAIGQALYYGVMLDKQPGIVLILEEPSDVKYLMRLVHVIQERNLNIMVYIVDSNGDDYLLD